ncbi:DUF5915 domain-containing protein, partial [Loigolactobacillus coryniformis]|nr:DUF5915 domain-containing protein [Loigolactobacillus coryniformis]
MRFVQAKVQELDQALLQDLLNDKPISIEVEGQTIELTKEDIQIQRDVKDGMVAANLGNITLALDVELTEELIDEG